MLKQLFVFFLLVLSSSGSAEGWRPWSTQHGGSFESCYEIIHSYNGLENTLYSESLDTVACSLISVVETESGANFDVLGHDYYPLLNSASPNYNFEVIFKQEFRRESETRNAFLLIAKDHLPDGKLDYRVELKLPDASPYDTITAIEELLIAKEVLERIESTAEESDHKPYGNAAAEIAGLRYFREIVWQINSGTFSLKADLSRAGFTAEPIIAEGLFVRGLVPPPSGPIDQGRVTAYDFVSLEETENNTLFRDLIGDGLKDPAFDIEGLVPLTSTIIITDELSGDDDVTAAATALANSDDKVIIWFHHTQDTLYTKKEFNFTAEEASLIIGHFYLEHLQQWQPELGVEDEEQEEDPEEEPPALQKPEDDPVAKSSEEECDLGFEQSCGLSWQWGKNCVLHEVNKAFDAQSPQEVESAALKRLRDLRRLQMGIVVGLFDGLLGTIQFVYDAAQKSVSWFSSIASYLYETMKAYILGGALGVTLKITADLKEVVDKIVASYKAFTQLIEQLDWNVISAILKKMGEGIANWFGGFRDGCPKQGYDIGTIVFEIILGFFSGGSSVAGKITAKLAGKAFPKLIRFLQNMHSPTANWIDDLVAGSLKKVKAGAEYAREYRQALKCKILGKGCFVKDSPVLMASSANQFSLKNAGKAMFMAAAMPIVPVPIQEVQLLDYAVAHETINSGHGLIASTDDDAYLGLAEKDPYTSDQQRARDRYKINDTDWYEVVFEEVNGSSVAKLALHDKWITQKGYAVGEIVSMNLPEQGIAGPFTVTSIRHILPQKRPVDEEEGDDYAFQPITGIFTHQSDDVWTLRFDNGDTLGVTYNHPIYSVTADDWRLAGALAIGEEVLTLEGVAVLAAKEQLLGQRLVWNLEVREWHNFLVGDCGVLVHNNYGIAQAIVNGLKNIGKQFDYVLGNLNTAGRCADKAKALRAHLRSKGHKNVVSERLQYLDANGNPIQGQIGWDVLDANGNILETHIVANNGFHEFTRINGKVYDNVNPNGIDYADFKARLVPDHAMGIHSFDFSNPIIITD